MIGFASLIRRFGVDERGVFAVIFGLLAVVLVALSGAVIDFVSLQQTRTRAQVALDASALALQNRIFETPVQTDSIKAQAQALLVERINDPRVTATIESATINVADGSLTFVAHISMPTIFVTLVGVNSMDARLTSEATRKQLELEVAMVLDNSGSMGSYNRMTYLKEAANCATNILFYTKVDANCLPVSTSNPATNVKIGIVPFTIMVNIGTQFLNASWLDWTGTSMIGKLNFDNDDNAATAFNGPVDRKKLFAQTHTSWLGCVEARLAPNDTTDIAPTGPSTLFVPMFSPDTADGNYNSYLSDTGGTCPAKSCKQVITETNCTKSKGKTTCTGPTTTSYTKTVGTTATTSSVSCIPSNAVVLSGASTSTSGSTMTTTKTYSLLSEIELQSRLCKYDGTYPSSGSYSGPNAYCPDVSILPLTANVANVKARISQMHADGGTNIQQGAVWGMHSLSSTEPLTQALVKNQGSVSKVMIIMTDGFNEPDYRSYSSTFNGTGIYGSWGFRKDGRLPDTDGILNNENEYNAHNSKADMTATMDVKTVQTCANAKAAGMLVYTIGLSSPSQAATDMLTTCSSGAGYYYFPNDPSELKDVFIKIAGQLAQLRIAQ